VTLNLFNRKSKITTKVERLIEIGAFIMLKDGRFGTLVSIDIIQGEKRGYVTGNGYAVSITDTDVFAFRNMELAQAA
jgi:hypothetical protein